MTINVVRVWTAREGAAWRAGEVLEGTLSVEVADRVRVGALGVRLVRLTHDGRREAEESLQHIVLWRDAELTEGFNQRTFTLPLEPGLHPSYVSRRVSVRYVLRVALDGADRGESLELALWPAQAALPPEQTVHAPQELGYAGWGKGALFFGVFTGCVGLLGGLASGLLCLANMQLGLAALMLCGLAVAAGVALALIGNWMVKTGNKGQALARCSPGIAAPGQTLRYQLDVTPTRALRVERLEWVLRCVEDLYVPMSGHNTQSGRVHYAKDSQVLYEGRGEEVRGAALAAGEVWTHHGALALPPRAMGSGEFVFSATLLFGVFGKPRRVVVRWELVAQLRLEGDGQEELVLPLRVVA